MPISSVVGSGNCGTCNDEDDDETVSLLANQESPISRQSIIFVMDHVNDHVNDHVMDQDKNESTRNNSTLIKGDAEKTFYDVCRSESRNGSGGSGGSDGTGESESSSDIDAVKDILSDIKDDIIEDIILSQSCPMVNPMGKSESLLLSNCRECENEPSSAIDSMASIASTVDVEIDAAVAGVTVVPGETSSSSNIQKKGNHSLVVDVHIPADPTNVVVDNNQFCKHVTNRFQRCYSDSSSSPKRPTKGKYAKWCSSNSPNGSTTNANLKAQESLLQNADKIESLGNESVTRDQRFRHSSDSKALVLSDNKNFNLHDELFQYKQNGFFINNESINNSATCSSTIQQLKGIPNTFSGNVVKFDIYANTGEDDDEVSNPCSDYDVENATTVVSPSTFGSSYPMSSSTSSCLPSSSSTTANTTSKKPFPPMDFRFPFSSSSGNHLESPLGGNVSGCLSTSSSTSSMPACRICQLPSMEPNNQLISPCRCLGSIRYVHNNCLLKWLEVSSKKRVGPATCELCQYQYLRHKKFVISHWLFPECSLRDKILHFFFIVSVCLMIACAVVTIMCFKEEQRMTFKNITNLDNKYHTTTNNGGLSGNFGSGTNALGGGGSSHKKVNHTNIGNGELTNTEMITLSCGVLFFMAFFLAMYVEVKAKNTVYQLVCKFFYMNHEWSVEEYDRRRDLMCSKTSSKTESSSCLA